MVSQLSPIQLSIAGGLAGIVEAICVQPFDMVKTRFHLNQSKNPSVVTAFKNIYKEGGILRFYRGVLPEMVGMVPKSSAMYGGNEIAKRELTRLNGGHCNTLVSFGAGWLSGYAETITVTPFQVIKVRLQAKEHLGRYTNTLDCIIKTLKSEGPRAFFLGFGPTCMRNCVWNSIYFSVMYNIKKHYKINEEQVSSVFSTLIIGFFAGIVATTFNTPFDVVKSRFQSELRETGKIPKYRYTFLTLWQVFKEEGFTAMYKGFVPKLWRMGVGGGVAMATFEVSGFLMQGSHL